jgi:preprotein translocase subunit SecF
MDIFNRNYNFDFVGKRWWFGIASGVVVVSAILAFFLIGPNWGIDFTGGTEIQLQFQSSMDASTLRKAVATLDLESDSVQQIGRPAENKFAVRIKDPEFGSAEVKKEVDDALVARFGPDWIDESTLDTQVGAQVTVRYKGDPVPLPAVIDSVKQLEGAQVQAGLEDNMVIVKLPGMAHVIKETIAGALAGHDFTVLQVDSVGPAAGAELRTQGLLSIILTLLLVSAYVAFRFDLSFAPGAILSLIHDVAVVAGFFVLSRDDFNLPTVGAMLTIIGYSLNDTIVIYDRIREDMRKHRRKDMAVLINDSINECLTRTVNTTFTVVVSMALFVFLGGPVIQAFAKAMLVGVITGCYSTIYVASSTILLMQDAKPKLEKWFGPGLSAALSPAGDAGSDESKSAARRRARDEAKSSAGEHSSG